MVRLDKITSEKLAGLCEKESCDLRDMAAMLWGLIMQVFCHNDSVRFEREFPGHDAAFISFDTSEQISARDMLSVIHEQSSLCPIPDGFSFADEVYRGIEEGYGEADEATFSFSDESLGLSVKTLADDEKHVMIELFTALTGEIAAHPDSPLNSLKRVTPEEEGIVMAMSKGKDMSYDKNETWLDLFKKRVDEAPDKLAVSAPNGDLTYRELDEASDRVASYILKTCDPREDGSRFVAMMTDRVKEYVIGIVGVHKAGFAYVPIDISYNRKRIDYMLNDSKAVMILDEETIGKALMTEPVDLPRVSPDTTAYMIYTSGSTGNPKGAMIGHDALMNYTLSVIIQNGLTPEDRLAAHKSFSFDAHIEDYFPPLSAGASVYIMPESIRRDTSEIAAFLDRHRITGCGFTTSVGKLLITGHRLKVRYITCGGEALTGVTASNVEIINEYGPTEFTNDSTGYKLKKGISYNMVPIGRPLPNCFSFVVDPFLNLVPKGAPGELCMAGVQAGKGYYGLPEKTRHSFMDCPFVPGIRMYRTGDIAKYLSDDDLTFIGRADEQVKLNGYRIELGEIEAVCGMYEGVEESVALIKEVQGVMHLILYYAAHENAVVDKQRLRAHMESGMLPQYMYPEIYMKLDEMPRLPNGKINKRNLPMPEFDIKVENVQPETALETKLLRIAKEVLPGAEFGITDDLFAMGLTSIGAMKFILLANGLDHPIEFRVGDIMRYHTISSLIEGNRRVCYRYNKDFDPAKPILVFIFGLAPVSGLMHMLDTWTDVFNVFMIEPIDSHYSLLFEGPDYQEIDNMYLAILESQIPGGLKSVTGLTGFSWGGFVAYTLAADIEKESSHRPFVLLGDTDLNECKIPADAPEAKAPDLPDNFFELTNGAITKIEALRRLSLVEKINRTVRNIPSYDGPVTMLDAALARNSADKETHDKKIDSLKHYASDPVIREFHDHDHDSLFYDTTLYPVYLEEMKKLLKRM